MTLLEMQNLINSTTLTLQEMFDYCDVAVQYKIDCNESVFSKEKILEFSSKLGNPTYYGRTLAQIFA